ncbi:MAG TPA: hypothetical protein VM327_06860 [Candidatus Thermoplasmatota archaeon]|nr:hypothetical protein [Candidatus Thermoplasmatota archaeon]
MGITTIQLDAATRDRLARLKGTETYDGLLNKLLALVPEGDEEGQYTDSFRMGLLQAKLDVKEGRVVPNDVVRRRLGL